MEIELAWSSVLKLFGMGVLTYLLSPVLLAVRDSIVWWSIKKFFYNKKTREIMARYCHDRAWVDFSGIIPFRILGSGENTKYYLNDREVTVDVFLHQKKVWEELCKRSTNLAITHKSMMHLDWQLGIQQQDLLSE